MAGPFKAETDSITAPLPVVVTGRDVAPRTRYINGHRQAWIRCVAVESLAPGTAAARPPPWRQYCLALAHHRGAATILWCPPRQPVVRKNTQRYIIINTIYTSILMYICVYACEIILRTHYTHIWPFLLWTLPGRGYIHTLKRYTQCAAARCNIL